VPHQPLEVRGGPLRQVANDLNRIDLGRQTGEHGGGQQREVGALAHVEAPSVGNVTDIREIDLILGAYVSATERGLLERDTGLMAPAGLDAVALARANGSWESLDEIDALIVPDDLAVALAERPEARERFVQELLAKGELHGWEQEFRHKSGRMFVAELAAELRKRGILFYLDATQSLGALRLNFQEIQPDLLAVNCYKWMLAPNGAAFMAVAPGLRQRLEPLAIGWRSHHDWRRVDWLHEGAPELMDGAEKYEAGMLSSLSLYALAASLELMFELGPERIEERVLGLAREVRARIRALGGEPLPYDNTAIVAARFPGHDASELAARLKQQRVLVSARHGLLRVSTHFYNNETDLDRFASTLADLL